MIIKSISVQNFRSITKTRELSLGNLSVLIGPNNEGKSNILQALVLTLNYLKDYRFYSINLKYKNDRRFMLRNHIMGKSAGFFRLNNRHRNRKDRMSYMWERDFPLKLQNSEPTGCSIFIIDFSLSKKEKYHLKRFAKINLICDLRIELSLGNNGAYGFRVYDTINLKKKLHDDKISKIQLFLNHYISVQYISAIRTSDTTSNVVEDMISNEIKVFEKKRTYRELLEKLEKMQRPILRKLSKNLSKNVSSFLPDIKKITIEQERWERGLGLESCEVMIDDGTKTHLELKGDGIKSLLAISIIQYATNQNSLNKSILLAIEEPESHLHPEAIHRLKKVLEEISLKNQVIITTHSPLLVSRNDIRKNILVNKSEAKEAESIAEVRKLLGVHVSDNLYSANLVILTEGTEDIKILKTWLSKISIPIKKALEDSVIIFVNLDGAANLSYKINQYKNLLCDIYAFLDADTEGIKAYNEARLAGLISDKEVGFGHVRGLKESEIEDMVDVNVYKDMIINEFNVNLEGKYFRNNKKKWSDRVRDVFGEQGRPWSVETKNRVKEKLCIEVEKSGIRSLKKSCRSNIMSIKRFLEAYLKKE